MRAPNSGSPPRMRGKPQAQRSSLSERRITPAHAGKTHDQAKKVTTLTHHPRACGENPVNKVFPLLINGSPPRMRGKHATRKIEHWVRRITPAHAGKTSSSLIRIFGGADHPRACGENRRRKCELGGNSGSPPRMRGKLLSSLMKNHCRRITPAHAGKTSLAYNNLMPCLDHPRACGENGRCWRLLERTGGSPPRMRGKLTSGISGELEPRITPAHAGKTY